MTVYVIADINVTDDSWIPDYASSVHHIVHKHGGSPLDTTLIAILEFQNTANND